MQGNWQWWLIQSFPTYVNADSAISYLPMCKNIKNKRASNSVYLNFPKKKKVKTADIYQNQVFFF
jgi:hypothetical protein